MPQLGELCLWAAAPLVALSAATSYGGAWSGRADLARLGGRAVEAAAALVFLSLIGLAVALVEVDLRYTYVARYSGFQEAWRLAALWSGPAGGALLLAFLLLAAAALDYRLSRGDRRGTGRAANLAVLAMVALVVVARAEPFGQSPLPATAGFGLPISMKDPAWQLQLGATYLAMACSAYAFCGIVGENLVSTSRSGNGERRALLATASLLTLALTAGVWRAYRGSGELVGAADLRSVAAVLPAWLLAFSFLHAPGGTAVPAWSGRWCRILGVATFPATLGAGASLLASAGLTPPMIPWAGGLAVGVIAGAVAGAMRHDPQLAGTEGVPGYGPAAFAGGLLALCVAGLVAVWGLSGADIAMQVAGMLVVLGSASAVAWHVIRPAGRWRRVWLAATSVAPIAALASFAVAGWRAPLLGAAVGLGAAMTTGLVAELIRVARARRGSQLPPAAGMVRGVVARRSHRRLAAASAHLGLVLVIAGLGAGALARVESRPLQPGESLTVSEGLGPPLRVTYLGLSRYQVEGMDRRVASFTLYRGDDAPQLVTASSTFEWTTRRQFRTPALRAGVLRDVIVSVAGRQGGEGVMCRLAARPLSGLVWLGGALLFIAPLLTAIGRWR